MHLADVFIKSDLQCMQTILLFIFYQYVCSLGIEPTIFCAANAMLYHWATGTLHYNTLHYKRWKHLLMLKKATQCIKSRGCKLLNRMLICKLFSFCSTIIFFHLVLDCRSYIHTYMFPWGQNKYNLPWSSNLKSLFKWGHFYKFSYYFVLWSTSKHMLCEIAYSGQ